MAVHAILMKAFSSPRGMLRVQCDGTFLSIVAPS